MKNCRRRQFFKYAREHFALDALDSYADTPDDPDRPVPNPAKAQALAAVSAARADLTDAHTRLADAIEQAAARAGRPGSGGRATVDPTATDAVNKAEQALDDAAGASRQTVSHLPLGQVRPGTVLLDTERKLITHAIRMSAYNTETALARLLRPHYARAEREGRALLREAFTLPGDLQINGDTLHVRLEPRRPGTVRRILRTDWPDDVRGCRADSPVPQLTGSCAAWWQGRNAFPSR